MKIVDVYEHKKGSNRTVKRIAGIAASPPDALTLFVYVVDDKPIVDVWTCLGFAIIEEYAEHRESGHSAQYVGPNWANEIAPIYQDVEGVIHPNINPEDVGCELIVTLYTPRKQIEQYVATRLAGSDLAIIELAQRMAIAAIREARKGV